MADYTSIMDHIDRGRGIAADHLGVPFDVYRPNFNTASEYLDPANVIAQNYNVFRRQKESVDSVEGTKVKSIIWDIVGDMSSFLLGDVFVQSDPIYGVGSTIVRFQTQQILAFCLAMHAPVKKSVGVFLDRLASVLRPVSGTDPNGYLAGDYTNTQPVVLQNGQFVLGTQGAPGCLIPCGINVSERWRAELYKGLPATTGIAVWYLYLPPLPGMSIKEGDYIQTQDGAVYQVQAPIEQQTGFVGNMLSCTRQLPQT